MPDAPDSATLFGTLKAETLQHLSRMGGGRRRLEQGEVEIVCTNCGETAAVLQADVADGRTECYECAVPEPHEATAAADPGYKIRLLFAGAMLLTGIVGFLALIFGIAEGTYVSWGAVLVMAFGGFAGVWTDATVQFLGAVGRLIGALAAFVPGSRRPGGDV